MNLTEKMALDCGVKISKPYLDKYFLPIKNDNYIIIDTRSKNDTGEYDYFNDVLDLIKDYLKEANITPSTNYKYIHAKIMKIINNRYNFYGYGAFSNFVINSSQIELSNTSS